MHILSKILVSYPILLGILLYQGGMVHFSAYNISITLDLNWQNKLISLAFIIITFATNLYSYTYKRTFETLIGNLYCTATLSCLLTCDFISMFIFLEFMMILAGILIYYGEHQTSVKAATQYFLTHLFSGGLILVGVSLIFTHTSSMAIIPLTKLLKTGDLGAILVLIGFLINVGMVPCAGWMVNCYPYSSSSGFIYLINFTSKISIIVLLKLFTGLEMLKTFGIIMILYGGVYAFLENNLKRLLCYLSVAQLGFILITISITNIQDTAGITAFIFVHILYTTLLCLYIAVLVDVHHIHNYSELKTASLTQHPLLIWCLIFGILMSVCFPGLWSFTIKSIITHDNNYYITLVLQFLNSMALFSVLLEHKFFTFPSFFKIKFQHRTKKAMDLSTFKSFECTTLSLFLMLIITMCAELIWIELDPITIFRATFFDYIKQSAIIAVAYIVSVKLHTMPRRSTVHLNLDLFQLTEYISRYLYKIYHANLGINTAQSVLKSCSGLDNGIIFEAKSLHDQQISILILFTVLIILIMYLYIVN